MEKANILKLIKNIESKSLNCRANQKKIERFRFCSSVIYLFFLKVLRSAKILMF